MSLRINLGATLLAGALASPLLALSANLTLVKIDTPDPVTAGAELVYQLTISSEGPDAAANTVLSDPLPAGTTFQAVVAPGGWGCTSPAIGVNGTVSCTNPSFAPGSAVFDLTVTVDASTPDGTVLTNVATVSSTTPDPNSDDNEATAQTTVAAQPVTAVSIQKTDAPDPVNNDGDLTYTLTANSNVARDVDGATLSDTLPAGTTFVSMTPPTGWSCATPGVGAGGTVSCSAAPFPQGDGVFSLLVHVAPNVAGGTILTNTATIEVDDSGRAGSASATATTQVLSPAALSATKATSGTPGATVSYAIVLTNGSAHPQGDNPGPELSDALPAELTLASASATSGVVSTSGNTVTWNGALAAGATVTITVTATVHVFSNGTVIANQATLAYDADGNGTNEAAGVSDDPATAAAGDPTTFAAALPLAAVPTLDAWGLFGAMVALAAAGWHRTRRRSTRG